MTSPVALQAQSRAHIIVVTSLLIPLKFAYVNWKILLDYASKKEILHFFQIKKEWKTNL